MPLFGDNTKAAALDALNRAKAINNSLRRRTISKRLDYYNGVQKPYIESALITQFKFPDRLKLQIEFFNVTRAIIDEVAVLYSKSPKRELADGTDEDKKIVGDIMGGNFDIVMDTANKMTKLCKVVLLRPVIRTPGKMEFDIITPDIFDVVQNRDDPTKADAIIYAHALEDTVMRPHYYGNTSSTGKNIDILEETSNIIFYYWSASSHFSFDYDGKLLPIKDGDGTNPYGTIPFIVIRDSYPMTRFFDESGDELIAANEIINIKLTELNYLTKMQAFSQPVRKGAGKGDSFTLDPSMCIDVPADDGQFSGADFRFVTPEAKITELADDIDRKLQRICMQYKLNPEMFKVSGDRSSGFSIQMQNFQLSKQIERDKPYYREYEGQIFELIKKVWNAEATPKISEGAKITVDFEDVGAPTSQAEDDAHNLLLYQNGLMSREEWLLKVNPDLGTIEEAKKRIEEIDAEKGGSPEDIAAQKRADLLAKMDANKQMQMQGQNQQGGG